MTSRRCLVLTVLLGLAGAARAFAEAPEHGGVPAARGPILVADAPGAPSPLAWQKVGVRLSYYVSDSVSPGASTTLTPQANGRWLDPRTGKTYGEKELRGSGGVGRTSVDIVGVEGDALAVSVTGYLATGVDLQTLVPAPSMSFGRYCRLSGDVDLFQRPERLAELRDGVATSDGVETRTARVPLELDGRTFRAISVATQIRGGWSNYVYDLDSGVLLVRATMTVGDATTAVDPATGRVSQTGRGRISSYLQLMAIRDLDVGPPADVTATLRPGTTIAVNGVSILPGPMGELRTPYALAMRVESAGRQSVGVSTKYLVDANLNVWNDGHPMVVSNNATLGFAVRPARFARTPPGTEVDRDPVTRTTVSYAGSQAGTLFLVERGATWEITRGYDAGTGLLVRYRKVETTPGVGTTAQEATITYASR